MPHPDDEEEIPKPDPAEVAMDMEQIMGAPKRTPAAGIAAMQERIAYLKRELAGQMDIFSACADNEAETVTALIDKTKRDLRTAEASLAQYQLQAQSKN